MKHRSALKSIADELHFVAHKVALLQKFHPIWKQVEADPDYQTAKAQHLELEKLQKESTKT